MLGYTQDEDILVTGQQNLPGFFFDGKAKALTEESLTQELPKVICDNYTCITFRGLFAELSNQMPANRRIPSEHAVPPILRRKKHPNLCPPMI